MVSIPLGTTNWGRGLSKEVEILLRNRYFESNPTVEGETALLSRPGLKKWLDVGDGPIRAIYSQSGVFDDNLFVVSGLDLYSVGTNETVTLIESGLFSNLTSTPEIVSTAPLGDTPEYLYLCDGNELWLYTENGYARGTLTAAGAIANGDVVRMDGVYYQFTSGSVDTGTPAGTVGNPWLVALGATVADAIENLYDAVGATGVAGTSYSTTLTAHTTIIAQNRTSTTLSVRYFEVGTSGNTVVTTETGANISWGGGTLADGGTPYLIQVVTPDDVGVVSLGFVAGYVIVVPAQDSGINGRFYWIEPGETTIDPLNFATAERSPDRIISVRVFGDQFWLLGANSTEVWYPSGDPTTPFQRVQGRLFDRGIWEGTAVQVKDAIILIDTDGVVYQLGDSPKRISDNSVEEKVRNAIKKSFT